MTFAGDMWPYLPWSAWVLSEWDFDELPRRFVAEDGPIITHTTFWASELRGATFTDVTQSL